MSFSPEHILEAKAEARAQFGRDALEEVTLRAPIDFVGLFAPLNFRAWCAHIDEQARDLVTSHSAVALRQRVRPDAVDLTQLFARWPAAPKKIAERLYLRAGRMPGEPRVVPIATLVAGADTKTDPRLVNVAPGLTLMRAQELLDAEQKADDPRELWTVIGPGPLSLVLAAPDADVYHAAQAADARAKAKSERIVEAKLDFIRPLVRWSSTPLDALLDDLPALSTDIKSAFDTVGGAEAEASSKSL